MAIADKFIVSEETAKGLVNGIKVGGLWGRIGVYFLLYIPISLLIGVALNLPIPVGINNSAEVFIKFFGFFGFMSIPFILTEVAVRLWRRKNGFSISKNIIEEIKQREVNACIAREEKARQGFYNPTTDSK